MIHQQIGISFHQTNSFEFDKGYDSSIYAVGDTDMYWEFENDENKYIISGVQSITNQLKIPLTIAVDQSQNITLTIDEWQNIDRDVYINDMLTGNQYKINDKKEVVHLEKGVHKDRFFLTFEKLDNLSVETYRKQDIKLNYSKNDKTITITCLNDLEVEQTRLFDITGINLYTWENTIKTKRTHELKVSNLNSGLYILRIKTNYGNITKKILIY